MVDKERLDEAGGNHHSSLWSIQRNRLLLDCSLLAPSPSALVLREHEAKVETKGRETRPK